jgi:hypothetical protein
LDETLFNEIGDRIEEELVEATGGNVMLNVARI